MCTVTFFPHGHGYSLVMNRDERNSRGATPPTAEMVNGVQVVYPRDVQGGTWIGVNQYQTSFALLNWNDVLRRTEKNRSRGAVVTDVLAVTSPEHASASLQQLDLRGVLPFRLIGVFGALKKITEWRWNQISVEEIVHPWNRTHWFSSSLSDENAAKERGVTCQQAMVEADAGSPDWFRRLHGSHAGGDALSLCVHRENVSTLSYSEIQAAGNRVQFNYFAGSPCTMRGFDSSLELENILTLPRK